MLRKNGQQRNNTPAENSHPEARVDSLGHEWSRWASRRFIMPPCLTCPVLRVGLAAALVLAFAFSSAAAGETVRSADAFVEFIGVNTHLGYSDTPDYHIYAGNTHSHTVYTWSHGPQFRKAAPEDAEKKVAGISVSPEGVQTPAKSQILKPDWQKLQGPPSAHFALAK